MKHRNLFFIGLFLVITIGLFACKTGEKIDFSKVKADDTIKVAIKDTIVIDLVSNPSTGYKWKYEARENEKVVEFIDAKFIAPKDDGRVGVAGNQDIRFLAKKKGKTVIELKYARGSGTPSKTHTVIVEVVK